MSRIDLVYRCENYRDAEIQRDLIFDVINKADVKRKKKLEIELISGVRICFVPDSEFRKWSLGRYYLVMNSDENRIYHSGYPVDLGGVMK